MALPWPILAKLTNDHQHCVEMPGTELDRNRTINIDNMDKRLALKLTMAFMVPIFTAHTNTRQIFVDIFFDEFYTSRKENPKDG
jgi:hypothetical protein